MAAIFTRFTSRIPCRTLWGRPSFHSSPLLPQIRLRPFTPRPYSSIVQPTSPVHAWKSYTPFLTITAVGLGLFANNRRVYCDAPDTTVTPEDSEKTQHFAIASTPKDYPPPPVSSVSLYQLSFGTVTGICAGIFIKKGAKAIACFFGGIFVLLQYLSSVSLVRVDWGRLAVRFEKTFYNQDANGVSSPSTVLALWKGLLNFLTTDFQPRASFIAGFVLGLRIG